MPASMCNVCESATLTTRCCPVLARPGEHARAQRGRGSSRILRAVNNVLALRKLGTSPRGFIMSKKNRRNKGGKPPEAGGHRRGPNATLDEHQKRGNVLQPPLAGLFSPVSWMNDRLPEMLWAILIAASAPREKAHKIFRIVAQWVPRDAGHPFFPVTLTGVASAPPELRRSFFQRLLDVPAAFEALTPLLLLPELPGLAEWQAALGRQPSGNDWQTLEYAVGQALDHQSEISTDVRWITVLTNLHQGRLLLPPGSEDMFNSLVKYPNFGDEGQARARIRSNEMAINYHGAVSAWPAAFWRFCMTATPCAPIAFSSPAALSLGTTRARVQAAADEVIRHCNATRVTTDIDAQHDAMFGGALYSLALLEELLGIGASTSITGRQALRTILEVYITLAYLCVKADPALWSSYRVYGSGQAKLALLKMDAAALPPSSISRETLHALANEDRWQEFLPIDLGHWAGSNLRALSEAAGIKDEYDRLYSWTSTHGHGHWSAVRDTVFDTCGNALHRLHRIPRRDARPLPDTLADAVALVDKTLALIGQVYPPFATRVQA